MHQAFDDLSSALRQHRVFLHLGWLDVKQRYRRSIIGPWWISLSMLLFISAMSLIFSRLLHQPMSEYLPFFAAGYILWSFVATSMTESTELFKNHSDLIKQIPLPYSLYILKLLTKNGIILGHNFIVFLLILVTFHKMPSWHSLLVIPALMLLVINLYWICLSIALLSARFRDITQIVNNCIQILFFVTPISWTPRLLASDQWVVDWNPFAYLLALVRSPFLGMPVDGGVWMVCSLMGFCGIVLSFLFFHRVRPRIPFWIE